VVGQSVGFKLIKQCLVVGQSIKSPTLCRASNARVFVGCWTKNKVSNFVYWSSILPLWLSTCACLCLCLLGFCFGGIMGCCPQKPKLLAKVKYTKLVLSDYD